MQAASLQNRLDTFYLEYHKPDFIKNDPLQIPHLFKKKQDIEIMSFLAAILAWGQRITIINSCKKLIEGFDMTPLDFIMNHEESDLKRFIGFKHRTFNDTDLLYFIHFLRQHYQKNESLETAFSQHLCEADENVEKALIGFHQYFCSLEHFPLRTKKHIATPDRNSACKRLNMFLRWMVREDDLGIDFGIWKEIKSSQLICPLDVHVERQARKLGLIERQQSDFKTAVELTNKLKEFDATDPVKYDFALFGMGVNDKAIKDYVANN